MGFGLRLKNIRLQRGYTQQELSEKVGVSVVALRNWEREAKKPAMDALVALGRELSVSLDELIGIPAPPAMNQTDSFPILSPAEQRLIADFKALDKFGQAAVLSICKIETDRNNQSKKKNKVVDINESISSERYIPKYFTPSAAGFSVPLDGDDFEMILADDSVPSSADYAVNIQGTSMEPYIHDGEMVFVKKAETISTGDIGIFSVDGAMYCKQYYRETDGSLILVSLNPEQKQANVFVDSESGQTVKLCGIVLLDFRIPLPDYLFED